MFLVTMRCQVDDIALGIYPNHESAINFAETLDEDSHWNISREVYGMDPSQSLGIVIIEFDELKPVKQEFFRWFDDEKREAAQAASENENP